jgi:hypothetical protein
MRHVVLIKSTNTKKFNYCKFGNYKDERGKLHELVDPNGITLTGYEMTNPVLSLDINDEDSKRVYEFLKNHPLVKGGKFIVEDLRANEEKSAESAIKTADAVVVASKLNTKEYRDMARLLGISTDFDDHLLKAKVIQSASANPTRFLDIYNDEEKDFRIFIKNAQESKHINFTNGVWKYGSNTLGLTVDQAISWFKDNPDIQALIKQDLRDGSAPVKEEKIKPETTEDKGGNSKLSEILNDVE